MDLTKSATLVSISIASWVATKVDRKVSDDVAKRHHTTSKRAGSYKKNCIDTNAPSYAAVTHGKTELRDFGYDHTLPFCTGWRIIKSEKLKDFMVEFRKRKEALQALNEEFINDYPRLKGNAQHELNGLYREDDYPSVDQLRERFKVDIRFRPVPHEGDFRVEASKEVVEEIKASIRKDADSCLEEAMAGAWKRLVGRIKNIREAMERSVEKPKFHDTLLENLREECKLLGSLNLTGDENLDYMRHEAEKLVKGITDEDLREDPNLRKSLGKKAAAVEEAMARFMK